MNFFKGLWWDSKISQGTFNDSLGQLRVKWVISAALRNLSFNENLKYILLCYTWYKKLRTKQYNELSWTPVDKWAYQMVNDLSKQ